MTEKMLTFPSPTSQDLVDWVNRSKFNFFSTRTTPTQTNKDICTGTTCADPGFFLSGGGGPGYSTYFTVNRGGSMVLLPIFKGSNFFRGRGGGPNANFYRNPCNYNL